MLKKYKKLGKKELKKDPLVIFAAEAIEYLREEWVKIVGTLGAVLFVILISLLIVNMRKRNEISVYDAALTAVRNDAPEANDLLRKVAFKSGSHSAEALLQLGNRYYQNKDLDNSEKCYTEFIKKYASDPLYGFTAYFNLGGVYEEKGDFMSAAAIYEQYNKKFNNSPFTQKMQMNAGRAYLLAGEKDSAKRHFLAIAEAPKDSRERQEALFFLETLR